MQQQFVIQIMSDNNGFVDYIPHSCRSVFDDRHAANKAIGSLQMKTKGNGFQYRVAERAKQRS